MLLQGRFEEFMDTVDPKLYQKYVTTGGKENFLDVKVLKELYVPLKSALFFYKNLVKI